MQIGTERTTAMRCIKYRGPGCSSRPRDNWVKEAGRIVAVILASCFFRTKASRFAPSMARPRVLLADDHASMLERAIGLVADEFDVVSAVSDGRTALDAAAVLQPDVVVFDISMPVMSGLEAAARLFESSHPP